MSSLAAEGNPKEAEIAISGGSVLSTAQLDIDFLSLAPVFVTPSTAEPSPTLQSSTCADVFEWKGLNDNGDFLGSAQGRDWMYLSDGPCLGTNGVRTKLNDTTMHLRINSTPTCYGVLWQKVYPLALPGTSTTSAAGSVIYWQTGFNGIIDGTPRAGPCIWVADATTHSDAILYAAVIDMDAGNIQLCQWDSASLAAMANATVLGTLSMTPSVGDILWLGISQRPDSVGFNDVFLDLRSSDFGTSKGLIDFFFEDTVQQAIYNGTQVRHNRMGVGFVSVGGPTAGKMEFIHSANESCWNGLVLFVDIDSSGGA